MPNEPKRRDATIFAAAVLLVPVLHVFATGREPTIDPKATAAAGIRYPNRVPIPDDLPSVHVVRGRNKETSERYERTILPVVLYLRGHYIGWQECLADANCAWAGCGARQESISIANRRGDRRAVLGSRQAGRVRRMREVGAHNA